MGARHSGCYWVVQGGELDVGWGLHRISRPRPCLAQALSLVDAKGRHSCYCNLGEACKGTRESCEQASHLTSFSSKSALSAGISETLFSP